MTDFVQLLKVGDEAEAEIVCGLLRTWGIRCVYRRNEGGVTGSLGQGGPGQVFVPEVDLERARELLAAPNVEPDG